MKVEIELPKYDDTGEYIKIGNPVVYQIYNSQNGKLIATTKSNLIIEDFCIGVEYQHLSHKKFTSIKSMYKPYCKLNKFENDTI